MAPSEAAVTFTVNSTADQPDGNPGDGMCASAGGQCTLRAAVEETNALPGQDLVNIPAGTYTLSSRVLIEDSVLITGAGAATTVLDGANSSPLLRIQTVPGGGPTVNISGVTLANGKTVSTDAGAGLLISSGASVTLADSIVRDNKSFILGGGVSNFGDLIVRRTEVHDNELPPGGGGVTSQGGGIYNQGRLRIDASLIADNFATRGGGISNVRQATITNTTISANRVIGGGGGIRNVSGPSNVATLSINASTITGNQANMGSGAGEPNRFGGGIFNFGTARIDMGNTILAGNTDGRSRFDPDYGPDCYSKETFNFTSHRDNLVGVFNANCSLRDTIYGDTRFDQVGSGTSPLDPGLQPLANNGGPTRTHALQASSPAIDADIFGAAFFDCPAMDQRGALRPADGNGDGIPICDIGAFELTPPPALSILNSSITERDSGTRAMKFMVRLSAPSVQTVAVGFATSDGTATAPSDYIAKFGTTTFNPNETVKTITVVVKGDTRRESNERLRVSLSSPINAVIADGVGVGTIIDDD